MTRYGKRGEKSIYELRLKIVEFAPTKGIICFSYCMKVEPFGYRFALERSLSAVPSARSVAPKTAGSRPARYSRWACKPEAQFQCALSRNNGYVIVWTLPIITRYRKTLRRRGLRHRIAYVARFRVVRLTQFRIFARKFPFSRSGSQFYGNTRARKLAPPHIVCSCTRGTLSSQYGLAASVGNVFGKAEYR